MIDRQFEEKLDFYQDCLNRVETRQTAHTQRINVLETKAVELQQQILALALREGNQAIRITTLEEERDRMRQYLEDTGDMQNFVDWCNRPRDYDLDDPKLEFINQDVENYFEKQLEEMTMEELQEKHEGAMMGDACVGAEIYGRQAIALEREMERREAQS